jgi:hypothetical protein
MVVARKSREAILASRRLLYNSLTNSFAELTNTNIFLSDLKCRVQISDLNLVHHNSQISKRMLNDPLLLIKREVCRAERTAIEERLQINDSILSCLHNQKGNQLNISSSAYKPLYNLHHAKLKHK